MNRPGYLPLHLTGQQLEAILARGSPLLIIAGPGSGKTEVVIWRVAHLVASGQADTAHCLVTTFTNKAALELKDRIQRNLWQADHQPSIEQMHVGTIHSLCAGILRDYQSRSPLPRGFEREGVAHRCPVDIDQTTIGIQVLVAVCQDRV